MRARGRTRVLALYPASRGVGFALVDHERRLVDWGTRGTKGRGKNVTAMRAMTDLILRHHPSRIVLEDTTEKRSRRHTRIRDLHAQVIRYAKVHHRRVRTYRRAEVFGYFGVTNKRELALTIAAALPALQLRVPPRRKPWMSEDARQSLFDAAALALLCVSTIEGTRRVPK
jgi:hypothetical protein